MRSGGAEGRGITFNTPVWGADSDAEKKNGTLLRRDYSLGINSTQRANKVTMSSRTISIFLQ